MNPPLPTAANPAAETAALGDFAWLMAAEGHRIDPERLHRDRAYARGCLALAGGSTSAALRQAAERLRHSIVPRPN